MVVASGKARADRAQATVPPKSNLTVCRLFVRVIVKGPNHGITRGNGSLHCHPFLSRVFHLKPFSATRTYHHHYTGDSNPLLSHPPQTPIDKFHDNLQCCPKRVPKGGRILSRDPYLRHPSWCLRQSRCRNGGTFDENLVKLSDLSLYLYSFFHQMLVEGIGLVRHLILLHGPRSQRCSTTRLLNSQCLLMSTTHSHSSTHAPTYPGPPQAPVSPWCGLIGISDDKPYSNPLSPSRFSGQLLSPAPIPSTSTTTTAVATTSAQPTPSRAAPADFSSQLLPHRLPRDFPFLRAAVLAAFHVSPAIPARSSSTSSRTTSSTRCWRPASCAYSTPSQPSPSTRTSTPTGASRTFPVWQRAVPG